MSGSGLTLNPQIDQMPTVDERLKQITLKVKRAKEHISDLNREVQKFLNSAPYKVAAKHEPISRKLIYYVSGVRPTPECLALIAGDAIQNLMCALDHLAFQLVLCDTSNNPPNAKWIYFPIANSASAYEDKKHEKMKGALPETFAAIDTIKPYKGGNDLLWSLYTLNNIEKHRLLITVGSMFQSLDLGADMWAMMKKAFPGIDSPPISAFFKSSDVLFPLKEGDKLFIGAPDEEVNPHMKFRFSVALNEPEIGEPKPLLETVHQLVALVEGIITTLTPRLN